MAPFGQSNGNLTLGAHLPNVDEASYQLDLDDPTEVVFSQGNSHGWFENTDRFQLDIPYGEFTVYDPLSELEVIDSGTSLVFWHKRVSAHTPPHLSSWEIYTPKVDGVTISFANVALLRNVAPIRVSVNPVPDSDGDGFPDDEDACPLSDLSPTLIIAGTDTEVENLLGNDGCTMADLATEALANGGHPGLVALANQWKNAGLISGRQFGVIVRASAQG